jgi:hypothetical protein
LIAYRQMTIKKVDHAQPCSLNQSITRRIVYDSRELPDKSPTPIPHRSPLKRCAANAFLWRRATIERTTDG